MISLPYRLHFASLTAVALLGFLFTACSDDSPLSAGKDQKLVRFNVEIGQGWNTKGSSPDDHTPSGVKTLTLKGGDSPLYLVPKAIDGISLSNSENSPTRSSIIDNENMESLGVFASIKPDGTTGLDGIVANYMSNEEVTRDNNWAPVDNYLWPGKDALHFNAYSPFTSTPGSEGITSLPSSTASGELFLSYSTPEDVADQIDLLISTPVDSKSSPCDLTFNHALAAVRFAAGAELSPCTVKSISLSNVSSAGKLNMESGEWSELSEPITFVANPEIELKAAEGSKFVASGTDITSEDQTFLLIPQTLPENAQISITFDFNGEEKILTSSLDGTVWTEGKTVVYRISANPATDSFILQLIDGDGNPVTSLNTNYTGSTLDFKVMSAYGDSEDTASLKNVAWKAEFIDENGNVIDRPQWISSWTMSGKGVETVSATTTMQTPVFEAISDESQALRNAADINTSSGYHPYNLSNPTGQATPQNTANCYLIHAPGFYSIPLVYGNAITDGKTNTSAYIASRSSNVHVLKNFVNHLGENITDPYIYNNANCTPQDAVLIWEGRLNLIQNVQLSPDKKRLIFTVSPDFICQGNAIVAVRDASGTILWSWHLWVTPYEPDSDPITITYHSKNYEMMTQNLGQISSGDRANFKERSVKVRYTQIPDDGSEPLSVTVDVVQNGKIVVTPDSYNYYQWGRKDPMISDIGEWYTADYNEITKIWTKQFSADRTGDLPIIADYIRTPGYFWVSPHDEEVFPYYNLWNTNNSTTDEVKTIYDPSPVGYMVARNVLTALNNATTAPADGVNGIGVNITVPGTNEVIFFPAHGYRSSTDGSLKGQDVVGTVWSSRTTSTKEAGALVFLTTSSIARLQANEVRAMAFGVRASKEL
ncbi:MAG: fimbrillin family protein [Muribaculaceae bacterium]|nr:fimbrillin family protein [Muribaculaceae bacterium]